jgi:hypothetical protein
MKKKPNECSYCRKKLTKKRIYCLCDEVFCNADCNHKWHARKEK